MMGKSSLEIEGLDELSANIARRLDKAEKQVENKGLREGGEIMAKSMKSKVNRSSKDQAHIQDHIKVSSVRKSDWGNKYVEVGPTKERYRARFLEYGTQKMSARPFVYPAFHETKKAVLSKIKEAFKGGFR